MHVQGPLRTIHAQGFSNKYSMLRGHELIDSWVVLFLPVSLVIASLAWGGQRLFLDEMWSATKILLETLLLAAHKTLDGALQPLKGRKDVEKQSWHGWGDGPDPEDSFWESFNSGMEKSWRFPTVTFCPYQGLSPSIQNVWFLLYPCLGPPSSWPSFKKIIFMYECFACMT